MYKIVFTQQAEKDYQHVLRSEYKKRVAALLSVLEEDPFKPPYEKLQGDLQGAYSRRINIRRRLIYMVYEDIKTIKILRMWTHYEK